MNKKYLISILSTLIFFTLSFCDTILIPEDYATIQEGIGASVDDEFTAADYNSDGILDIVQIINYILSD